MGKNPGMRCFDYFFRNQNYDCQAINRYLHPKMMTDQSRKPKKDKGMYVLKGYVYKRMSFLTHRSFIFWDTCHFYRVDISRVKLSLLLYSSEHGVFTFMNSVDGTWDRKELQFSYPEFILYDVGFAWTSCRIVYVDLIIDHCVRSSSPSLLERNSRV